MKGKEYYMAEAIRLGEEGMMRGDGGPFGAVVVKGEEIIGRGWNNVLKLNDPTAHAEITAIRDACRYLSDFQLRDCHIYCSCEPCPMCLGAIYWARPARIFYACTRTDAAEAGFDDSFIYKELSMDPSLRKIPSALIMREEGLQILKKWMAMPLKIKY